jgi:chemotaxis protein histidine kinase CheA/CheY-like chemotaxis protein
MRNHAYQLFIHEAVELLQQMKDDLLTISQKPRFPKTHTLVRTAQIISGGAAEVNFTELSTLTLRLEQVLSYLWHEQVEIDADITEQLLQVCDCIQLLLAHSQIHQDDASIALIQAEPVITQLELRFKTNTAKRLSNNRVGEILQILEEVELAFATEEGNELTATLKTRAERLLEIGKTLDSSELKGSAETMLASLSTSPQTTQIVWQIMLDELKSILESLLQTEELPSSVSESVELEPMPVEPISTKDIEQYLPHTQFSAVVANEIEEAFTHPIEKPDEIPEQKVSSNPVLQTENLLVWTVGAMIFTLPYACIEEHLTVTTDQIFQIGQHQRFLHWQEQMIPFYQLSELLSRNLLIPGIGFGQVLGKNLTDHRAPLRFIIRQGKRVIGLESTIEHLVTKSELVIQPFSATLSPVDYCCGFTVLENEHLATVIDVASLLNQTFSPTQPTPAISPAASNTEITPIEKLIYNQRTTLSQNSPVVLVVDGYPGQQSNISVLLQKAGYQIFHANDGQEAIARLRHNFRIKLIICIADTPKLTDLMFLTYRLQDPQLAKIPVVMIGSRESTQFQQVAMKMGTTTYFTKPYDELEFLAKIRQLVDLTQS